ncbi:MAG: polyphosphate kinase 1 [Gammaproteobacteria bacterium]|nr:MAG: polyphosphate kinase 1 [Gammaproteobacteria bacterium]
MAAESAESIVPAVNEPAVEIDLDAAEWYLNRETTWLEFNRRVLHEAEDDRNPLLERVKFLAILSSNMDEFFMKRIGGLKQQIGAGVHELSVDGQTPQEQMSACHQMVREIKLEQRRAGKRLTALMRRDGIKISLYPELSPEQQTSVRQFYIDNIYPLISPMVMDPAHPFPFISNLSLNLLVSIKRPDGKGTALARIKVPTGGGIHRFIQIDEQTHYVPLENVIAHNLDLLFPGVEIQRWDLFRVTRNAITERSEEQANDLLELIESELRDRKFAPIVRLEVSNGMPAVHRGMLAAELGLDEDNDVFDVHGLIQKRDLFEMADIDRPDLRHPPHHPVDNAKIFGEPNIFHLIRSQGPILLQHPYESFATTVERFVREAARDPKVLAIKMTLYRTAEKSRIVDYLMEAAHIGKLVMVAVELKARFDESANIRWANQMEQNGIHVSYGVVGLKTHSKVVFVLRRDYDGLRRYAHLGTGNYHSGTARIYSDLGMLTCDPVIGEDLTELFNFLTTGFVPNRDYKKLLPAPKHLKKGLLARIRREIDLHSDETPGHIQFKMNALEDKDITRALYEASLAGVKVDLIVRDTCRLRPGIPGLSENVNVISIVGRVLEHARIFYFRNNGEEEYLIGSADCMRRNLESRVEIVVPIDAPDLKKSLREILNIQLDDHRAAWDMQSDGSYTQRKPGRRRNKGSSQDKMLALAEKRLKAATRLGKKIKPGRKERKMI